MRPRRTLLAFFAKVGLVYAVFLLPFSLGPDLYGMSFRGAGNFVFATLGRAGRIEFKPLERGSRGFDTEVELQHVGNGSSGAMQMNSRKMGYLPTAFLIGLVLATPVPWSRRGKAMLWGLGLMGLFVAFKLYLRFLNVFSDDNALAVYTLGPFWKSSVMVMLKVFAMSPVTSYIAPIFIWILVLFRRDDIARLSSVVRRGSTHGVRAASDGA